jgi:predicted acetyltransferase
VGRIPVTGDGDTAGSAAVIERSGGALEGVASDERGTFRRYWI